MYIKTMPNIKTRTNEFISLRVGRNNNCRTLPMLDVNVCDTSAIKATNQI